LEANNTIADHQVLQNIASKSQGRMVKASEINLLADIILSNKNIAATIFEEKRIKELIEFKWIFYILLALVSLEWFLRKRNGAY